MIDIDEKWFQDFLALGLQRNSLPERLVFQRFLLDFGASTGAIHYAEQVFRQRLIYRLLDRRNRAKRDRILATIAELEDKNPVLKQYNAEVDWGSQELRQWRLLHQELLDFKPLPSDLFRVWFCLVIDANDELQIFNAYDKIYEDLGMQQTQASRALRGLKEEGFAVPSKRDAHARRVWTLILPDEDKG